MPLGLRDGRRWLRVVRRDGDDVVHDLTLPLGPAAFAEAAAAIEEHARSRGVDVLVSL
ncbi:hypothetical protein OVA14_11260 [Agrococcus sp. SL85]|uniref:hypothetical protein n=1 Tax=Agrococcus sp. SL85 TaxID=2995141 RepID=UPI00226D0AC4|nr:hypothetical protein [Agrococcus sp. SL85]WAC65869.1 hypothetical protein OVA14_11260 [Agrococcus sp. SL85]